MLDGLRDLVRHRALIGVLVGRELKARYRGSVLGYVWSLLNPLLMLAVYTVSSSSFRRAVLARRRTPCFSFAASCRGTGYRRR